MDTLQDFIERFNTQFYSATSVSSMGWEDEEICEFLNTAQLLLVEESIAMGNFEIISNLIETEEVNVGKESVVNTLLKYELDKTPLFIIGGTIKLNKKDNVTRLSALDKVQHSDVSYLTSDVMVFRNPKLIIQDNSPSNNIEILVDSLTEQIIEVNLRYVIPPEKFDVDDAGQNPDDGVTNLNKLLHTRLVAMAVEIAAKTMLTQQQSTQ